MTVSKLRMTALAPTTKRGFVVLGTVTGMQTRLGGTGEPARAGWPACDYSTGHLSAFAILVALYHRLRSGIGESQHA